MQGTKKRKGYRMKDREMRIIDICNVIDPRRGVEVPCLTLVDQSSLREYSWVGEAVNVAMKYVPLSLGYIITVNAFAYGPRLRKVRISRAQWEFNGIAWHKRHPEVRPVCW